MLSLFSVFSGFSAAAQQPDQLLYPALHGLAAFRQVLLRVKRRGLFFNRLLHARRKGDAQVRRVVHLADAPADAFPHLVCRYAGGAVQH